MNIYEFASESPWLAFFIVFVLSCLVEILFTRFMRARNISKHGWPPAGIDADGDFKKEDE